MGKDTYYSRHKDEMLARSNNYYNNNKKEMLVKAKKYYKKTKDKKIAYSKIYHEAKKEKIHARKREYHKNNREKEVARINKYAKEHKKQQRAYRDKYKEEIKLKKRKYDREHRRELAIYAKKYKENNKEKVQARRKRYQSIRYNKDYKYKLSCTMSAALRYSLKGRKNGVHWELLLNYTTDDLKRHLEKQFKEGMTWDNHGEWHIDHIIPISLWNFISKDDREFKQCWALCNLQPLWAEDNLIKGNRFCGAGDD